MGALPPTIRLHLSEDHAVRIQAEASPTRPPSSVKMRTLLTGRSRSTTSSISWTGTGVYTVRSWYPLAFSSSRARTVVSTWAKTPRIVSVVAGMPGVLDRCRQGFLHLDDGKRRHQLDEAEEQDEEPREAADDDGGIGDRRHVDAPRVRIEVVGQPRYDDVEALEPHPDEHQDGDHVQDHRVGARLLPEQDQRRHAGAEVHDEERPPVGAGEPPEQRGPLDVVAAVPGGEQLADVEVRQ